MILLIAALNFYGILSVIKNIIINEAEGKKVIF